MTLFGSSNKTTQEEAGRKLADATSGGSGAEQDRHEAHFSGAVDKLRETVSDLSKTTPEEAGRFIANKTSGPSGSEQDRLGGHLSGSNGGVLDSIKKATGFGASTESTPEAAGRKISESTTGFSGAEQDRYAAHFGIGSDGLERLKKVAEFKGEGAEQDRYNSHFGLDADKVKQAADSILHAKGTGAEQDRHASHFGLGADGWKRAQELANTKGVGAEQDRYGAHFGLDRDTVSKAAESIREGAQQNLEKK